MNVWSHSLAHGQNLRLYWTFEFFSHPNCLSVGLLSLNLTTTLSEMCKLVFSPSGSFQPHPTHPLVPYPFHQHKKSCYTIRSKLGRFYEIYKKTWDYGVVVNTKCDGGTLPPFWIYRPCIAIWTHHALHKIDLPHVLRLVWLLTAVSWFKLASHVHSNILNAIINYFLNMLQLGHNFFNK